MESVELLSKQIEQYNQQNREEHEVINAKIDRMLTEIHVLYSERNVNEKRFDDLEKGQNEIKETTNNIDDRIKRLEERDLKRQHSWNLALKVLGVLATAGAIIGVIIRFF